MATSQGFGGSAARGGVQQLQNEVRLEGSCDHNNREMLMPCGSYQKTLPHYAKAWLLYYNRTLQPGDPMPVAADRAGTMQSR